MALATQCPHCLTTFRVAADQLKLRGGIVRCGACQNIFDGSAHLIELDKPATPPAPSAPPTPAVPAAPDRPARSEPPASAAASEDDALPVYTLDFTQSFEPLGILPNVAGPAPSAVPSAVPSAIPSPDAPVPRARVWRTGTSAQAPVAEPVAAATPDEPSSATLQATAYAMRTDAAANAASPAPDSASAAAYGTPPAADAYAPAGRIAPHLEPLPGAHADATVPDAGTGSDAGTPPSDAGIGSEAGTTSPDAGIGSDAGMALPAAGTGPQAPAVPDAAAAPASAYAPGDRIEAAFGLAADEDSVARPLPDDGIDLAPPSAPAPVSEPEPAFEPSRPAQPGTEPAPPPARPLEQLTVQPPAPPSTQPAQPPLQPPAPPSAQPPLQPPAMPPRQAAGAGDDVPSAAVFLRASAASESALPAVAPTVPPARSKAARASEARARRSKLTPTKIEPPKLRIAADTDADEPEFVKRSRRQERTDRTRRLLMIAGTVVLLFVLLAQVVLGWRNVLAQRHPGLKPVLAGACAVLGCRVELPALADNLVIETGELTTLGPNTYALNTLLRNQGSLVLAWPSIELELTDAADRPVLRRVLAPGDYLPAGTSVAGGFGAHSEQPVTLHFTLAGLQPSGYHTFVFYP